MYRHRDHYELSGQSWEAVSKRMSQLIAAQNADFCYPEVHAVLLALKQAGWKPGILTFGDAEYQHYKIGHCKLLAALDLPVQVVTEPKRDFLAREFTHQAGILVDDKYPLKLPTGWRHIWINRGKVLQAPLYLPDGTWQISILTQLPELLESNVIDFN